MVFPLRSTVIILVLLIIHNSLIKFYFIRRFLSILLEAGTNAYMTTNSSAGVFEVPNAIDATTCSIKRSVEPLIDSLHQLLNMYTSRDQRLLLGTNPLFSRNYVLN